MCNLKKTDSLFYAKNKKVYIKTVLKKWHNSCDVKICKSKKIRRKKMEKFEYILNEMKESLCEELKTFILRFENYEDEIFRY